MISPPSDHFVAAVFEGREQPPPWLPVSPSSHAPPSRRRQSRRRPPCRSAKPSFQRAAQPLPARAAIAGHRAVERLSRLHLSSHTRAAARIPQTSRFARPCRSRCCCTTTAFSRRASSCYRSSSFSTRVRPAATVRRSRGQFGCTNRVSPLGTVRALPFFAVYACVFFLLLPALPADASTPPRPSCCHDSVSLTAGALSLARALNYIASEADRLLPPSQGGRCRTRMVRWAGRSRSWWCTRSSRRLG